MDWQWLIPVAVLFFWIVGTLIQGVEKERSRMNRQRSLPGSDRPPGDRSARRPPSDIDRFLEEVNRRRRQAAERRPLPGSREKPPAPVASPVPMAVRPRSSQPSVSGRRGVPVQPVGSRSGKILEAIPATETTATAEVLAVASALHTVPMPASPPEPAPAVKSASAVAANAPSVATSLAELLRMRDNLRTAVILHEIFGPPRSRRHEIR